MLQIMACIGGSNHLRRIPNHIIEECGTRDGSVFQLHVRDWIVNLFTINRNEACGAVISIERYIMDSFYDNNNKIEYLFAKEVNMDGSEFKEWCLEIITDKREIYK